MRSRQLESRIGISWWSPRSQLLWPGESLSCSGDGLANRRNLMANLRKRRSKGFFSILMASFLGFGILVTQSGSEYIPPRAEESLSTNKRGTERITPYILRDIDNELRRQLQSGGFIIVTGDSTAGKSRTAYEAMRATVPDHLLLMPANREALPTALSRMLRESRCILWLDDVERFLGSGGLTRTGITQILAPRGHGRIILGTMRAAELARYVDDLATADNVDRQVVREIRETLSRLKL